MYRMLCATALIFPFAKTNRPRANQSQYDNAVFGHKEKSMKTWLAKAGVEEPECPA